MERRITIKYSKAVYVEVLEAFVEKATGVNIIFGNTIKWPVRDLGPNGFRANRSYNDFVWLRNQLKETMMFIPGLPPKNGLFSRIPQEKDTIDEEMRFKLERFLNRIYERDFLKTHSATKAFMSAQDLSKDQAFKDCEAEIKNLDDEQKIADLRKAFPGIDDVKFPDDIGDNSEDAVVRLHEIFVQYKKSLFDILLQMQKFIISLQARSAMDESLANIVADNLETERCNESTLKYTSAKVGVVKRIMEWGSYYSNIANCVERHLLHPMGYEYEDSNAWLQLCDYNRQVRGRLVVAAKRVDSMTEKKNAMEEKTGDVEDEQPTMPKRSSSRNPFTKFISGTEWTINQETELQTAIENMEQLKKLTELSEKVVLVYERPKHWNGKNRSFNLAWGEFKEKHAQMCSKLHTIIKNSEEEISDENAYTLSVFH